MAMTPTHGHASTGRSSRIYNIWRGIRQRCNNPKASYYAIYGGAGIKVCDAWDTFEGFLSWAKNSGYADTLTIERRSCTGNYEPSNCYWADMSVQQSNKRKRSGTKNRYIGVYKNQGRWTARVTYRGVSHHVGEFASELEAAQARDAYVVHNSFPHKLNF